MADDYYYPTWLGTPELRKLYREQAQLIEAIRERTARNVGNDAAWVAARRPRLVEIDAAIEALLVSIRSST